MRDDSRRAAVVGEPRGDAVHEVDRIVDQLERSYAGDAWHGPSVKEVLKGVGPATAAARPLATAHSIWEIVLHMATWKRYVHEALGGAEIKVADDEDWPPVKDTSAEAWRAALKKLDDEHAAVTHAARRLSEDRLDKPVTRRGVTAYRLLEGIVQHDLYHAGQIRMLAKHG
jgi:uncharacterized damage-inducible protein DinB